MHRTPEPDAAREIALGNAVREAIGGPFRFLDDGPDLSSLVLGQLWRISEDGRDPANLKAFCAVMAMAADALRGARATILIHELGSVFTLLRRFDEMQTLAFAIGLVEGEARRWLTGGPVNQRDLRRRIELANPALAATLRTSHGMLSNEVHGRTQSLAVYENVHGNFEWPPRAEDIDPVRVQAACAAVLAALMTHFAALRWMLRDWMHLSSELRPAVAGYYDALVEFVVAHQVHGDWQAIAPGHAAAWLGISSEDSAG